MTLWKVRLAACWLAVIAAVPYFGLKLAWLSGFEAGENPELMARPEYLIGNLITAGLALAAIGLTLMFTFSWGRRVPVWMWLAPAWVGTGLLLPIGLGTPVGALLAAVTGAPSIPDDPAGGEWVFAVVYIGFTLQAAGLLTAIVTHIIARWPELTRVRITALPALEIHRVLKPLTVAGSVVLVAAGAVRTGWGLGGRALLPGSSHAADTVTQQVHFLAEAVILVAGAAGALVLCFRRGTGRVWLPLAAAWAGAGTGFAQSYTVGLSHVVNLFSAPAGVAVGVGVLLIVQPLIGDGAASSPITRADFSSRA